MSKQLKPEQWLELFNIYETFGTKALWYKYATYKEIKKNTKYLFFKKYKKFLYHNRDMNTLISMTGKAPKKGTKSGRPKNSKDKIEIWKEFMDKIGKDEVANIFKKMVDDGNEDFIDTIKEIIKKKSELSSRKMACILGISKSSICNLRSWKEKSPNKRKLKKQKLANMIYDILVEHSFRLGREPIAQIMLKKYGISISGRQVGRIMRENHLSCEIRVARKISERKDTAAMIPDLVKRDYDNKNHNQIIRASDVTYITGTYDAPQNFVYLSVIINHRTKEIESWELSMYNDAKLIIDSFTAIKHKLAGSIVHTDHGADYTSKSYQSMLSQCHAIQSMSRVGNSLDNRDIEFWFSIFKTELI
ncbi:MAG: DDE-type integrase/transposase/recombinase, partial [Mycoplasmataceae bacterium]|nr:DDE-type integrase/transposase/recombinase [Mycoplasmataceae bacterium]